MSEKTSDRDDDFLSLAATRLTFTGGKIQGRRLIPDDDHVLEPSKNGNKVMLRMRGGGGGVTAEVSCDCAAEGGSCVPVTMNPGDIDEHLVCVPDGGCGSSGLLCFMGVSFTGGGGFRFML